MGILIPLRMEFRGYLGNRVSVIADAAKPLITVIGKKKSGKKVIANTIAENACMLGKNVFWLTGKSVLQDMHVCSMLPRPGDVVIIYEVEQEELSLHKIHEWLLKSVYVDCYMIFLIANPNMVDYLDWYSKKRQSVGVTFLSCIEDEISFISTEANKLLGDLPGSTFLCACSETINVELLSADEDYITKNKEGCF